ncbi:MAG TPA: transketolase family protein [Chloroflexi bacterium]|jgi:transketolase|nr:transketolase family protein [Chloroflexota bacterium]
MTLQVKPTRDGYGDGLVEAGQRDERIVVLGADLTGSTRADRFATRFPERFVECGIAEQNALNIASGLALAGKIPFVSTYAVFVVGRALDQIRTTVCYSQLNVKIAGAHGGISVGADGATHQALEDVATLRAIPGITVIVPCDYYETRKAIVWAAEHEGPVYVRFGREPVPVLTDETTPFVVGKAQLLQDGTDVTIINNGPVLKECLDAVALLQEQGIAARLLNMPTVKPIDREAIIRAARETGAIVTVEEHQVMGGFGSAVAEVVVQEAPVPMRFIGIQDRFGESGEPEELFAAFGLKAQNIVAAACEAIAAKKAC